MVTIQESEFKFLGYKLLEFSLCHVNPDVEASYCLKFETLQESLSIEGKPHTVVQLKLYMDWDTEQPPFEFQTTINGLFSHSSDMPDDVYRRFCKVHAPALLYSQLRPIVRLVGSEAELNLFLPLANIAASISQANSILSEGSWDKDQQRR